MLKVLLVGRPHLKFGGGGDRVVILKTQQHLKKLGVDAQITYEINPNYKGFDIAHLFTLSTWQAARKARDYGITYVVSPIYWDPTEGNTWVLGQKPFWFRLLKRTMETNKTLWHFLYFARNIWRLSKGNPLHIGNAIQVSWARYIIMKGGSARQREVLEWASHLMPGSKTEMKHIEEKFGGCYPYTVVPHGVEPWFAQGVPDEFVQKYGLKDFVLSISAGFSYRKNQLSLIRALKGSGIPLVILAGARSKAEQSYYNRCRREADDHVLFLPPMPQEDLVSVYKAAKVFALPSLFETPGLVYLEAAAAGCNVVATEVGSAKEYLGDLAWYCNPYDIDSIRQAVLEAYNAPRRKELQEHVLRNFTWERAAQLTLEVYRKVLNGEV